MRTGQICIHYLRNTILLALCSSYLKSLHKLFSVTAFKESFNAICVSFLTVICISKMRHQLRYFGILQFNLKSGKKRAVQELEVMGAQCGTFC